MAKIAFFCIPARGHTNPTLPVVRRLVEMGHEVIYYSFAPYREDIEAAGAKYVDSGSLDAAPASGGASVTSDIGAAAALIAQTTLAMEAPVLKALTAERPDVIVADSAAAWGRLFALKLGIPLVCSNTTFVFNRHAAKVMKSSFGDLLRLVPALFRASRALRPLRDRGYPIKGGMDLMQGDPSTPTVVYTSRQFQPCAETFSDNFHFVGPCLRPCGAPVSKSDRPLIYVSMGTVMTAELDFLRNCAIALDGGRYDVIISAGSEANAAALGSLPGHVRVYPRVDQLSVLQSADAFITHCGMNSASEALYYGVPLITRPLTPEEAGVANRAAELGAGLRLTGESPEAIRAAVETVLTNPAFREAAARIGAGFRDCGGAEAAAQTIISVIS